jgi:hypothetical protein
MRIKHKKKEEELLDCINFLENKVLELEEEIAAQKLDHTEIANVVGGRYTPNFRLVVYEVSGRARGEPDPCRHRHSDQQENHQVPVRIDRCSDWLRDEHPG